MSVIEIEAVGLASPIGLRRHPTLAAMRAAIRAFRAPNGGPCRSQLHEPDIGAGRLERAQFYLRHALDEALESVTSAPRELAVYLIAPEALGSDVLDEGALAGLVGTRLAAASWRASSFELHRGRAGALAACAAAQRALENGSTQALVVATECLTCKAALARLSADRRLIGQSREDGVIPGEGGAAVLLRSGALVWPRPALATVTTTESPVASEREPARARSAEALASACRRLRLVQPARMDRLFSTSFPRHSSTMALNFACTRNAGYAPAPANAEYLGAALGELGAAALVATLARAVDCGPALIFDHESRERVLACALVPT